MTTNEFRVIIEESDLRQGDRIKIQIYRNGRYLNKILALGKKWQRTVAGERRPDFEGAAERIFRRALKQAPLATGQPLKIRDGKLMHQHDAHEARVLERTLKNGLIHPDVRHSFVHNRTLRPKQDVARPKLGPAPRDAPRTKLYIRHFNVEPHYPSHRSSRGGYAPSMVVHDSHVQLAQPKVESVPTNATNAIMV
jgi:hypothetical protein